MTSQRGSASVVLVAAIGFGVIMAAFSADVSRVAIARARAQAAADGAALAAAQELVRPSGRSPAELAADYAGKGGASLVRCECPERGTEAVVTVEVRADLPMLGRGVEVRASARAVTAAPPGSEGLQAFFAARLGCLFGKVSGLWIVSGFRTRAEQADLHRRKPDLAAPPGRSNHELGLAADLGYPSAGARREAHRVAPACGLEFPVPHEPWHVEPAGL